MKKRSKKVAFWLILVAVISLILYFGMVEQSIYSDKSIYIQNHVPDSANITWNGFPAKVTSVYLGNIINTAGNDFCGSNDGDLSLSNSYQTTSNILTLSSSVSQGTNSGTRTCGGNYILVETTVPVGIISGTCTVNSAATPTYCQINKVSGNPAYCDITDQACQDRTGTLLAKIEQTGPFSINITELTTIRAIIISTRDADLGGGASELTLGYTPLSSGCTSDVDCITANSDCYWQCSNNQCSPIVQQTYIPNLVYPNCEAPVPGANCTTDKCDGTKFVDCINGNYISGVLVDGKCGYINGLPPPEPNYDIYYIIGGAVVFLAVGIIVIVMLKKRK